MTLISLISLQPKQPGKFSLRLQLTLLIFFAASLVLVAVSGVFAYQQVQASKTQALQTARSVVSVLSQDMVREQLLDSPDIVFDMASKLRSFKSILQASFFLPDRTLLFTYTRPGLKAVMPNYSDQESIRYARGKAIIYLPVEYLGQTYGMAYFEVSLQAYEQALADLLRRLLVFIPLVFLLSLLLAYVFQRYLSHPVQILNQALVAFGRDQRPTLDMSLAKSSELCQLFEGFNRMAEQVAETQQKLRDQKVQLEITLHSIADGVVTTDRQGLVQYMNPAAELITGWSRGEGQGKTAAAVLRLAEEPSGVSLDRRLEQDLEAGKVRIDLEGILLRDRAGRSLPVQIAISPILDENKQSHGSVIVFQDISRIHEMASKLRHQASHDPLTGLANRVGFDEKLKEMLKHFEPGEHHTLLYLDLDQFKVVNDSSGHSAGDVLLRQVALLLKHAVRESDLVARLGGDEFAILLPDCGLQDAEAICNKIIREIGNVSFSWHDKTYRTGVSIGVVVIADGARPRDDILSAADIACYTAKDLGRNRFYVYRDSAAEIMRRSSEMQWMTQIRDALEHDRLRLYAQRIDPLNKQTAERHVEILIRYENDVGEITSPGSFLPAVERFGLAPKLDRWVLNQLFSNPDVLAVCREERGVRFNINLSGHTLNDEQLSAFILSKLKSGQLDPRCFCFEITETAAISNLSVAARFMNTMRSEGFSFALDDFGSGVSSFGYLKNLPVDYLKIDGVLVKDIHNNPVTHAMVKSINEIGHVMGLKTVAEFVENESIYRVLSQLGVDFAQGYFLHKPCALNTVLEEWSMPENSFSQEDDDHGVLT